MSTNHKTVPGNGHAADGARQLMQARHLLVDLDGTLVRQNDAIDGAAALLAHLHER